jgi:3-deoxy-7-phosphoheptulonate synthase
MELEDKDLSFNYRSHCDPRLNYEQSLGESYLVPANGSNFSQLGQIAIDVAFLVADNLKAKRRGTEPKDVLLAELRGRSSTRS